MKILVGQHELKIDKKDKVNQNEYKVTKCEFEFDEAITNDLVKVALFTNSAGTYKQYIVNNECDIPAEILEKQETTTLGVYAYKEENEELELRYSPEEIKFYVSNGSYKEDAENTEPITPTDKEQMEQALQNGLNDINNKIDEVDEKLDGIETAIEETNNLNLDVSDKVDGDVTVTLTKKDASTKTVVLSDGTSLEFNWDGTKLGIKTSDEEEYTYVDLQGIQGPVGPQGEAFRIKKTYSSVAEMNADFNNMEYGDYVMIASSVEVEDNAKLYTRGESQWIFITDFSGSQGIKGETGLTPSIQIGTVVSGATPSVTRTGTDENPVLNFVLQKGDKGDKGNIGDTGNGISSIEKTSTSGLVDTYTITYTNGNTTTFNVSNGNGIDRIEKTATVGNKDTYTIYFTNGSTTTYEVSNGEVTREELEEEVDRLSMIYNAFPTTTGEGEEPSINGTAEVPFKEIGLKGNTSQESTTGKQLFNKNATFNTSGNASVTPIDTGIRATITRAGNYRNAGYVLGQSELLGKTISFTYDMTASASNVGAVYTYYGSSANTAITRIYPTTSGNIRTFTIDNSFPEGCDRVWILFYANVNGTGNVNDYVDYKNLMIVEGSYTDQTFPSYEPYTNGPAPNPDYPYPVNVVTGDNEVKVEGKNLAYTGWAEDFVTAINDSNYAKLEVKDNRNCLFYVQNAGYGQYDTKNFTLGMTFKENTQYTISYDIFKSTTNSRTVAIYYTDGTNTQSSNLSELNKWEHQTITSSAGKTIDYICPYYTSGSTYIDINTWQIEEGTTETPYEPYQSQTYPINLGSMELCKIGDYQDYFYKSNNKWYLQKNIGKVVLDGTNESFTGTYGATTNGYAVTKTISNLGPKPPGSYSNNFKFVYNSYLNMPLYSMGGWSGITTIFTFILDSSINSLPGANNWLSTHNTEVRYVLATPTITEITDTTLIEQLDNLEKAYSYDTQTNISQTNQDKPFIISYEAILSLKNVLNS